MFIHLKLSILMCKCPVINVLTKNLTKVIGVIALLYD
jgi:hypothetical protein